MRAVSLLVLLGCSLLEGQSVSVNDITRSHYGGRENQIQAENPTTEPPATTSTQQSCQPDIHSVLREVSVMLAELKVEQRHTTTAVNNMESRLRASESQMEELKKKVEVQSQTQEGKKVSECVSELSECVWCVNLKTSFKITENQVESLKRENQEELKDLKTSFSKEVENLKRENQERKVVFSASLSGGEAGHTGPYSAEITLVYKQVFTNIGNAYNPATGIFTAPVRGVYQFRFSINGGGSKSVTVVLHKNGHHVVGTHAHQPQGSVSSSNGVSLLLEVGDVVCLKLPANAWVYDDWFHHSTFSGSVFRMRAVSLLVLLGCSLLEGQSVSVNDITLSHYGGRENETQTENPDTEPSDTTSTQQGCQPDIHSVLREVSVMLAELKVEQRHTTAAVNNMESRLRASESQMEELKKKNEEEFNNLKSSFDKQVENLKSSVENLKSSVEILKSSVENLQNQNEDLKTSFTITETQVESLNRENQERKVVFSASLSGGEECHTGPYSTDVTLVYKHVFTNIGNAYNPATGVFTAPVRGVYQFKFHIFGWGGRVVGVALQKNGHHVAGAYAHQNQHAVNSSNGVSLLLEVGDAVFIKLPANFWIYDNKSYHSTFSGQMLFSV
ncbi:hypothetical protein NFI96_028659 [Prochilodus magdalenae]|nr:hypothetical protein NFI96_028659 [Prochilodus magdalenae]